MSDRELLEAYRARDRAKAAGDERAELAAHRSLRAKGQLPPVVEDGQEVTTSDAPVSLLNNIARRVNKELLGAATMIPDAALAVTREAARAFTDTPEEELEAFDKRYDLEDTLQGLLDDAGMGGITKPKPKNVVEAGILNVLGPVATGQGLLGTARTTAGRVGRALRDDYARYAKTDAAAATAGGIARTLAEGKGDNPDQSGLGFELAANFMVGSFVDRAIVARNLYSQFKNTNVKEMIGSREFDVASDVMKGSVREAGEDPAEVVTALKRPEAPGTELLTPAAKARSPALAAAERSVLKGPEATRMQAKYLEVKQDASMFIRNQLVEQLGGGGVAQDYIDTMMDSADYAVQIMEKNVQMSLAQLAAKQSELPPIGPDLSQEVKDLLITARNNAREVEQWFWAKSGLSDVSMDPLSKKLDEIMSEAKLIDEKTDYANFPDAAIRGLVKELGEAGTASSDEIVALRSVILESAAEASADGKNALARRLNDLAGATLDTLDTGTPEFTEAFNEARRYSKELNDRFSRDIIAPLLGRSARRGELTPGNELMDKLMRGNEAGRTNMQALKIAMGDVIDPARPVTLQNLTMPEAAQGYIMKKFLDETGIGLDYGAGESFIKRFGPMLEEAGLLQMAQQYVDVARMVRTAEDDLVDFMKPQNRSIAEQLFNKFGHNEKGLIAGITTMLQQAAGGVEAKLPELFRSLDAAENFAGMPGAPRIDYAAAEAGLKTAIVEAVLRTFYTRDTNILGTRTEVSQLLDEALPRITYALTATGKYTIDQVNRVAELADIAIRQGQAERQRPHKGQSSTSGDLALASSVGVFMRFLGLRAAGVVKGGGPGSLQIASLMGRIGARIGTKLTHVDAQELLNRAVFDKELLIALLERPDRMTEANRNVILRALTGIRRAGGRLLMSGFQPSQLSAAGQLEELEDK